MRALHVIVCLKVVPKPEEVTVNRETMTIERANVRSEINPADMNALELALSLKEQHQGRVTLVAMGPPLFDPYLRLALAMGADAAYLLSDRAFAGADTLATSYTLAEGIRKIGDYDLILCGEESSDGATAQVPPGIAEWLGIAQITYAHDLEVLSEARTARARRELAGGHEVIQVPLPCVASVVVGANEPRFMDMERKAWAQGEGRVTVWTAQDLGIDEEMIGLKGSPTIVSGVEQAAAVQRKREFLRGTPQEEAQALVERVRSYL
ncbi:MAG: electron transfer flavoprotein subunit beta/FixA family protein [Chloroflexota bacterium]|nr:electron transfer flavoprotein subunit beta/FixA family protein [Chloroflexota bacterium]